MATVTVNPKPSIAPAAVKSEPMPVQRGLKAPEAQYEGSFGDEYAQESK